MTDTLKSDLNGVISALLEAGLGLKSTHVAAVEKAIAELDRLEVEVKKSRLPDFIATHRHYKGGLYQKLFEGFHSETQEPLVIYRNAEGVVWVRPKKMFDEDMPNGEKRFTAFLPTPDVVPSTEPVQADGDGAGERSWIIWDVDVSEQAVDQIIASGGGTASTGPNFTQEDAVHMAMMLRELRARLSAPASPSDQGQRSQTPMNTETAEKPKPVSLADEVHRTKPRWAHGGVVHENEFYHALDVIDARLRTLRGV